jgi:hypothetical protein
LSHAKAYDKLEGFELAGLCARSIKARTDLPKPWSQLPVNSLRIVLAADESIRTKQVVTLE